jgi:hypothetical protein
MDIVFLALVAGLARRRTLRQRLPLTSGVKQWT